MNLYGDSVVLKKINGNYNKKEEKENPSLS